MILLDVLVLLCSLGLASLAGRLGERQRRAVNLLGEYFLTSLQPGYVQRLWLAGVGTRRHVDAGETVVDERLRSCGGRALLVARFLALLPELLSIPPDDAELGVH